MQKPTPTRKLELFSPSLPTTTAGKRSASTSFVSIINEKDQKSSSSFLSRSIAANGGARSSTRSTTTTTPARQFLSQSARLQTNSNSNNNSNITPRPPTTATPTTSSRVSTKKSSEKMIGDRILQVLEASTNKRPATTTSTSTTMNSKSKTPTTSNKIKQMLQQQKQEQDHHKLLQKQLQEKLYPPTEKSIYSVPVPSASSTKNNKNNNNNTSSSGSDSANNNNLFQSLVVLQNNTLCCFGGLHESLHLVFLSCPPVEATLPSNYELYVKACLSYTNAQNDNNNSITHLHQHKNNSNSSDGNIIEPLLTSLSITPGRFNQTKLSLHCDASFGSSHEHSHHYQQQQQQQKDQDQEEGAADNNNSSSSSSSSSNNSRACTIVPLIHHNRHMLQELELQCSGLTDSSLRIILSAISSPDIPEHARDNLAIALSPQNRLNILIQNGGRFFDIETGQQGTNLNEILEQHTESHQNKKKNRATVAAEKALRSNESPLSSSFGGGYHEHDDIEHDDDENNASIKSIAGGGGESISSPQSKTFADMMKMEKLRNAVSDVVRIGSRKTLRKLNLSCNIGITDSVMVASFIEEHTELLHVNVQQTGLDHQLIHEAVMKNRRKKQGCSRSSSETMMKHDDDDDEVEDIFFLDNTNNNNNYDDNISQNSSNINNNSSRRRATSALQRYNRNNNNNSNSLNKNQNNNQPNFVLPPPPNDYLNYNYNSKFADQRQYLYYEHLRRQKQKNSSSSSSTNNTNNKKSFATSSTTIMSNNYNNNNDNNNHFHEAIQIPARLVSCSKSLPKQTKTTIQNNSSLAENIKNRLDDVLLNIKSPRTNNNNHHKLNRTTPTKSIIENHHNSNSNNNNNPQTKKGNITMGITKEQFLHDVRIFKMFMNPHSGMLELSRITTRYPALVNNITTYVLSQRSKVEEKIYQDTVNAQQKKRGEFFYFTRSKLPLAEIPEISHDLRLSAQQSSAYIERQPSLSLETINFVVYLQSLHPELSLGEIERAIMKYCEFAIASAQNNNNNNRHKHKKKKTKKQQHKDNDDDEKSSESDDDDDENNKDTSATSTRANIMHTATESIPLAITVEAIEMFDALDKDKRGYLVLDDFIQAASSKEGKEAARYMFMKYGLVHVRREEAIPLFLPYLFRSR